MAPKSKAAEAAAIEEEDYTAYADKEPTDLQERFTAWILDKTEVDPAAMKTKQAAFEAGVRLGVSLRMKFQASPENQAVLEERRNARAADDDEDEAPAKPVRKARGKAKAKVAEPEPEEPEEEVEEDETDEDEEAPAPKKRRAAAKPLARKAPAKSAAAKPARRKAKAADAPF